MRHVAAVAFALGLLAGAARAELCTRCRGLCYTTDLGKCAVCAGHTGSGAFKLCSKCSTTLGQCEHCRAKLPSAPKPAPAKPKPAPTTRPAKDMATFLATLPVPKVDPTKEGRYTYTRGRWMYAVSVHPRLRWGHLSYDRVDQRPVRHNGGIGNFFDTPWGRMYYHGEYRHPWGVQGWQLVPPPTGPGTPARLRLREWEHVRKRFLTGLETLRLYLQYHGPQDKPYYSLTLRVPAAWDQRPPFWPAVQIEEEQARTIVEHLGKEGFLLTAENITSQKVRTPRGPTYTLTAVGTGGMTLREDLGWNLEMLTRLDDLRKSLDGAAAEAMDKLLARMAGHRKQWTKSPATRPATGPAARAQ